MPTTQRRSKTDTLLCVRLDALGDLINTTPALAALRAHWPERQIVLVTTPHNVDLLNGSPLVDQIIPHSRQATLRDTCKLILRLRQLKPTTAIIFSPKTHAFWLARLTGAQQRVGVLLTDGGWWKRKLNRLLLTHCLNYDRQQAHQQGSEQAHHAHTLLRLTALAGTPLSTPPLSLPDHPNIRRACTTYLSGLARPLRLCHIDERWALSNWETTTVLQLIDQLASLPGSLILTTDIRPGPITQALEGCYPSMHLAPAPDYFFGARGATDHPLLCLAPPLLAWQALIQQADHVITPECGCVHLAAAWQVPTTVLIAEHLLPGKYAEWYPWQNHHTMVALNQNTQQNIEAIVSQAKKQRHCPPTPRLRARTEPA